MCAWSPPAETGELMTGPSLWSIFYACKRLSKHYSVGQQQAWNIQSMATPQSQGGRARAKKLTTAQRRAIALQAARARWDKTPILQKYRQRCCEGLFPLVTWRLRFTA